MALCFNALPGFFALIDWRTLGVCNGPADRLRRERALAEDRGPIMALFLFTVDRFTAW